MTSVVKTEGVHLLVEYWGCDTAVLNDVAAIEEAMGRAASAAGAAVVASVFRPFEPSGVTGVVVLEESHLSVHTWPEDGYAAVDFFTCGDCVPERAHAILREAFLAEESEILRVLRGRQDAEFSLEVDGRVVELRGDPEVPAIVVDEDAMDEVVAGVAGPRVRYLH